MTLASGTTTDLARAVVAPRRALADGRRGILPVLALAAALSACGAATTEMEGGQPQGVRVEVTPSTAGVASGGVLRYAAAVTGSADTNVVWQVVQSGGGSIDADGLYRAPSGTGTFTVRAVSRADPSVSDTATVTVASGGPVCGNGSCEAGESAATCGRDCSSGGPVCGDGSCDAGESFSTCSQDCTAPASGSIIADHTVISRFSAIPPLYLERAKALTFHIARASHGNQILQGMGVLEAVDPRYSFAVREDVTEGLPAAESPIAMRIYDGNPPETYIYPSDYWEGESGKDRTRAVVRTGRYDASMYVWCWQQEQNRVEQVQSYLATLDGFEDEFPGTRFVYMTGHADGTHTPTTPNTLKYNNELVRRYVRENGKVLFDFEDIDSHDPAGNYHPNTGTNEGECTWCQSWCDAHPADCADLPAQCAHSQSGGQKFICIQKAKAFWWMMARLAGWDGN